jgi:uncharacterized protein YjbI with pentapeptide repeats
MNIIQPLDLETGYRTFSFQKENYLVVSTKLYFPLNGGDPELFSNAYQAMSELPAPFIDEGLPKISPEYFIAGNIMAPNGQPIKGMPIHCKFANSSKSLHASGDRYWLGGLTATSQPIPFVSMPLTWPHAFGGKGFDVNPNGQGIDKVPTELGGKLVKMPNIEYSNQLLTSLSQRPKPAGFSTLMADHPQRLKNMGTYNEQWLKEDFPGYPKDFNFAAFNCAPEDQILSTPIEGDESFELEGFHDRISVIEGRIPKFTVKTFVVKKGTEISNLSTSDLEELKPSIDTVAFFPNQLLGMLVYRSTIKIESTDASEFQHILCAYEDHHTKRDKSDYLNSLIGRIHPDLNMQYALTTKDLIPTGIPCGMARLTQQDSDPKMLLAEHIEAQLNETISNSIDETKQQLQALIDQQKAQGLDTSLLEKQLSEFGQAKKDEWQLKFEAITERLAPTDKKTGEVDLQKVDFRAFDDLSKLSQEYAEFQKNKAKLQLENQIEEALAQGNEHIANELDNALSRLALPPELPRPADPKETLLRIKESVMASGQTNIDLNTLEKQLEEGFLAQIEGYKMGAHMMDTGRPPLENVRATLQEKVDALIEKGESLKYMDLAGLSFSNKNLSGVDFSYCYLEQCDFSHADLSNANLSHAIAARSNFKYAKLINTNLNNSNIGACNFNYAIIDTPDTSNIECAKSDFSYGNIKHISFADCLNMLEMTFHQTHFKQVNFGDATFLETTFSQSIFDECQLESASFQQSNLDSIQINQSTLISCNFIECAMNNLSVKHSDLSNCRFISKTTLNNGQFYHSILANCTIKDIDLTHSKFIVCTLNNSDFSDANASQTIFDESTCKDALFIKTKLSHANLSNNNFMYSNFMQADLVKANISHSNLYGCEFLGAHVHNTDFARSNMNGTKLENWRPSKWQ